MDNLQYFRFRIIPAALKEHAVEIIRFPWTYRLNNFYDELSRQRGRKIGMSERATWRTFNDAMNLSAYLVQAFETGGNVASPRIAIAPSSVTLPQANQIGHIARQWLNHYTLSTFPEERQRHPEIFKQLLGAMEWNETWSNRDALSLIKPGNIDSVAYTAIPSLVSSSIVNRSINFNDHLINWRAAQQDHKLMLVSQPIFASRFDKAGEKGSGYFVIQVEFALRTMPGNPDPFIDMFIRTRRYIEAADSNLNRKSGKVQIETSSPLIKDWPQRAPVQVPLVYVKTNKFNANYRNGIDQFLAELNANQIISPTDLLKDPKAYWNLDGTPQKDGYYLVYQEGTRPNHPFETGFPIGDKQILYQEITRILDGVLEPIEPIIKCDRLYHKNRPTASMHVGDLRGKENIDVGVDENGKPVVEKMEHLGKQITQAIQEVWRLGQAEPFVFIFWFSEITRDALLEEWKDLMGDYFSPIPVKIPPDLWRELVSDDQFNFQDLLEARRAKNGSYANKKEDFYSLLKSAKRTRIAKWVSFIRSLREEYDIQGGVNDSPEIMAVIEQSRFTDNKWDERYEGPRSPKSVIREACVKSHVLSQFIFSVETAKPTQIELDFLEDDDNSEEAKLKKKEIRRNQKNHDAEMYRVKGSLYDLLLRQTGITLGSWDTFLSRLQIPEKYFQAEIIGLFRARSHQLNLDIPVAIRFRRDMRHAEMTFPGINGKWLPYIKGCVRLGELIIQDKGKIISWQPGKGKQPNEVCLDDEKILSFVDNILRGPGGKDRIVLIHANNFRTKLNIGLRNPEMELNKYKIGRTIELSPRQIPSLRLIRILTNEAPDYIDLADIPNEPNNSLFRTKVGEFDVFYSIGELATVRRQLTKESSKIAERRHPDNPEEKEMISKLDLPDEAFKHSQMVEIIPYFMQQDDDPEDLVWIAHRLRSTINWAAGNILLPRPIHLAEKFFDDMKCLYDSDNAEEE